MSTTAELAYRSLRKMVLDGELVPGQRVSQLQIARVLRCSTVPVVEALRRLESEGLLTKQPRKMARVRVLVAAEVEGLFLMRQALEMASARLCAQRIEDAEVQELLELAAQFESAAGECNSQESDRLDMEIHRAIVHFAKCPLLEQELDRLHLIERTVPGGLSSPVDWDAYRASHNALIQAIRHRDPDSAEYLMKKHIAVGFQQTLERAHLENR